MGFKRPELLENNPYDNVQEALLHGSLIWDDETLPLDFMLSRGDNNAHNVEADEEFKNTVGLVMSSQATFEDMLLRQNITSVVIGLDEIAKLDTLPFDWKKFKFLSIENERKILQEESD